MLADHNVRLTDLADFTKTVFRAVRSGMLQRFLRNKYEDSSSAHIFLAAQLPCCPNKTMFPHPAAKQRY